MMNDKTKAVKHTQPYLKPPGAIGLPILESIHAFDGMLGAKQIQRLHFDTWRTTRGHLSRLYKQGYIDRPDRKWRAALPEMIYWLTELGAEQVAGLHGQDLREFKWRREPRHSLVEHDLWVNEIRITIMQACERHPYKLEEWIPSGEFWAFPDEVEYLDGNGRKATRRVRPDGYFVVGHWQENEGKWNHYRMLLELDRATEDNPRFAREKVYPGVAYLRSPVYERRFGSKAGRWLIVTTGERRMQNMKRQTENAVGRDARFFFFTTFDQVSPQTVLTEPIWYRGEEEVPVSLFS